MTGLIARELAREGLPRATFGPLDRQELIVATTADRSVLGCMNDIAVRCEHAIPRSGGLRQADLADLNRALRCNTNSARGYERAGEPGYPPHAQPAPTAAAAAVRGYGSCTRDAASARHAARPE